MPIAWKGRVWIWRTSRRRRRRRRSRPAPASAASRTPTSTRRASASPPSRQGRVAPLPQRHHARTATGSRCSSTGARARCACWRWRSSRGARRGAGRLAEGAAALVSFAVCALGDSPLRQPGIALLLGLLVAGCPRILAPSPRRPSAAAGRGPARGPARRDRAAARPGAGAVGRGRRLTAARDAAPASAAPAPRERRAGQSGAAARSPSSAACVELETGTPREPRCAPLRRSRPLLANVGTDVAIGNAETAARPPRGRPRAYGPRCAAPRLVSRARQHEPAARSHWAGSTRPSGTSPSPPSCGRATAACGDGRADPAGADRSRHGAVRSPRALPEHANQSRARRRNRHRSSSHG